MKIALILGVMASFLTAIFASGRESSQAPKK